jgi:hypothetical protein
MVSIDPASLGPNETPFSTDVASSMWTSMSRSLRRHDGVFLAPRSSGGLFRLDVCFLLRPPGWRSRRISVRSGLDVGRPPPPRRRVSITGGPMLFWGGRRHDWRLPGHVSGLGVRHSPVVPRGVDRVRCRDYCRVITDPIVSHMNEARSNRARILIEMLSVRRGCGSSRRSPKGVPSLRFDVCTLRRASLLFPK